jgi:hypothetical protein
VTAIAPKASKVADYDPAEHRVKHCWSEPRADFVTTGVGIVGKCPSTLSKAQARELLNDAEFEGKQPDQTVVEVMPERVWNVHEGVIYEAVSSGLGAYHGYPWRGRPGRNRLARGVKRALQQKADTQGYGREFQDWLKRYES